MVRSTPAPFTLHPNSQGRYPGSPLSETEDSDDGVCTIPIAAPKAAFVAKADRSGGRAPKQNAASSSGSRPERSRSPPEQGPSSRTGPQPQTASIIPGGDINPRVSAAEGLDSLESETLQMDPHPSTPQASTAVAANHFASSTLESLRSANPRFDVAIDQWRVPNDEAARLAYLFHAEIQSARIARIGTGTVSFSRSDLIGLLDQAIFVLDAQSNFDIDHSRHDSDFDDVRETQ